MQHKSFFCYAFLLSWSWSYTFGLGLGLDLTVLVLVLTFWSCFHHWANIISSSSQCCRLAFSADCTAHAV